MSRLNPSEINKILKNPVSFRTNQLKQAYASVQLNMNQNDIMNSDYVQIPINTIPKQRIKTLTDKQIQEVSLQANAVKRQVNSVMSLNSAAKIQQHDSDLRYQNSRQKFEYDAKFQAQPKNDVSQQFRNQFTNSLQRFQSRSGLNSSKRSIRIFQSICEPQLYQKKILNRPKYLHYDQIYYNKLLQEEYSRQYYSQLEQTLKQTGTDVIQQQREYFRNIKDNQQLSESQLMSRIKEEANGMNQDDVEKFKEEERRRYKMEIEVYKNSGNQQQYAYEEKSTSSSEFGII